MNERLCTFDNCDKSYYGLGLCQYHYNHKRQSDKPLIPYISKEEKQVKLCVVEDCGRKHSGRGFCKMHLNRIYKNGDAYTVKKAPAGSGYINKYGYRQVHKDGISVLEHRWIFEQYLGRELGSNENIHHKNGIRSDNRLENLELWVESQPPGQRAEDLVNWAQEIISLYGGVL